MGNERYESFVEAFIVANRETFVSGQYLIKGDGKHKREPDFVAIRPGKNLCYLVEVSAGSDSEVRELAHKVCELKSEWIDRLKASLEVSDTFQRPYECEILVFVRSEYIELFKSEVGSQDRVHVWPLEITLMDWLWTDSVWSREFNLCDPRPVLKDESCLDSMFL